MGLAKLQWQANRLGYSLALTPARGKLIVMPKFKVVRHVWNKLVVNKHIKSNLRLFHVFMKYYFFNLYTFINAECSSFFLIFCEKQSLKCRLQINVEFIGIFCFSFISLAFGGSFLVFFHPNCWRLSNSNQFKGTFFVFEASEKNNTLNRGKVLKISYFVGSLSYW